MTVGKTENGLERGFVKHRLTCLLIIDPSFLFWHFAYTKISFFVQENRVVWTKKRAYKITIFRAFWKDRREKEDSFFKLNIFGLVCTGRSDNIFGLNVTK